MWSTPCTPSRSCTVPVEVAVTDMTDPRLVDAGVPEAVESAEEARKKAEAESGNPRLLTIARFVA